MSCPCFYPVEPRTQGAAHQDAMLPLGAAWTGVCRAVPESPWQPDEALLRPLCNLGYARGHCARFPGGAGPDAFRFTLSFNRGAALGIDYVAERDHHPFAHGSLEYSIERGVFVDPPASENLERQAHAYVDSYLRRKAEGSKTEALARPKASG